MLESLIDAITPWFRDWGLVIIFAATFLESSVIVASFLPGESVLLLGGLYASPNAPFLDGADPPMTIVAVVSVAFAGAVAGDLTGYLIGRVAGRAIVRKVGRFVFLPESRLPVLERYFDGYGGRAILLGRFAPFLRSVRTLVAGIVRMPMTRFVPADVVGAAVWAFTIVLIGFVLGESWRVANRALGAFGFLAFAFLVVLFVVSWRRVRARVERELAMERPPRAG